MLRMAKKYSCQTLRDNVVTHLSRIYPCTPKRPHCDTLTFFDSFFPPGSENHPFFVIRMARENNILFPFLPTVFYLACQVIAKTKDIPQPPLSPEDQHRVLRGQNALLQVAIAVAHRWISTADWDNCDNENCLKTRVETLQEMYQRSAPTAYNLFVVPMPHEDFESGIGPADADEVQEGEMCQQCFDEWKDDEVDAYDKIWKLLPSYFDLPGWP